MRILEMTPKLEIAMKMGTKKKRASNHHKKKEIKKIETKIDSGSKKRNNSSNLNSQMSKVGTKDKIGLPTPTEIDKRQNLIPSKKNVDYKAPVTDTTHRQLKASTKEEQRIESKNSISSHNNSSKGNNKSTGTATSKSKVNLGEKSCSSPTDGISDKSKSKKIPSITNSVSAPVATHSTSSNASSEDELFIQQQLEHTHPMFNDVSNISTDLPNKAVHSKKDTSSFFICLFLEEIRRQLSAMRAEQDLFSVAFDESIAVLKTQHKDFLETQTSVELSEEKYSDQKKIFDLKKYNLNLTDDEE
ncbi:Myb-like DNA-binding domain protein [Reticulomyxa filosa]|uniref:Myb-like DNA-binding domain protein n=1 Tax=Reticulomyxa filosa TaxID=46433 RepID=X6N1C1_RETFI|nr:Myb-like DNA-binding domain protein [Reticulomyxa filosa]|eukprot:ETO19846.1 Myb-like DNA-binding domain protein [Reticulomyxa filosa]